MGKNEEVIKVQRITRKSLLESCKANKLYSTPRLNDVLYLHYKGYEKIESLEEYTALKCIWLECNALTEISGLDNQAELKCLFLHNNLIKKIENLEACKQLDTLNLSHNQINKIENCGEDILPVLNTLNLSHNYLRSLEHFDQLKNCANLSVLDLSHNRIDDILIVKVLGEMPELRVLTMTGNPVLNEIPAYRKTLILECKKLTYLDSRPVFPRDRACAEAWKSGGFEAEKREHSRWVREDRRKIRQSVNDTLNIRRLRSGEPPIVLRDSDSEDDEGKNHSAGVLNGYSEYSMRADTWKDVESMADGLPSYSEPLVSNINFHLCTKCKARSCNCGLDKIVEEVKTEETVISVYEEVAGDDHQQVALYDETIAPKEEQCFLWPYANADDVIFEWPFADVDLPDISDTESGTAMSSNIERSQSVASDSSEDEYSKKYQEVMAKYLQSKLPKEEPSPECSAVEAEFDLFLEGKVENRVEEIVEFVPTLDLESDESDDEPPEVVTIEKTSQTLPEFLAGYSSFIEKLKAKRLEPRSERSIPQDGSGEGPSKRRDDELVSIGGSLDNISQPLRAKLEEDKVKLQEIVDRVSAKNVVFALECPKADAKDDDSDEHYSDALEEPIEMDAEDVEDESKLDVVAYSDVPTPQAEFEDIANDDRSAKFWRLFDGDMEKFKQEIRSKDETLSQVEGLEMDEKEATKLNEEFHHKLVLAFGTELMNHDDPAARKLAASILKKKSDEEK